jgi:hypothetical protein
MDADVSNKTNLFLEFYVIGLFYSIFFSASQQSAKLIYHNNLLPYISLSLHALPHTDVYIYIYIYEEKQLIKAN